MSFPKRTLEDPEDICSGTVAKRRRFSDSDIVTEDAESPSKASGSMRSDSGDRFLPSRTSRIPFFPLHMTSPKSRYAAELFGLAGSKTFSYRDKSHPLLSQASSDPTFRSRMYHSQLLDTKDTPVISRYSAVQNASSSPVHIYDTGIDSEPPVHPCAWSCRNTIAAIFVGKVFINNNENSELRPMRVGGSARSVEWLSEHTMTVGGISNSVDLIDADKEQITRTWTVPLSELEKIVYEFNDTHLININALGFSKERNLFAAGRWTGSVTCYDPRMPGEIWHNNPTSSDRILSVRWSPDGLYLAVGDQLGNVSCVDIRSYKALDLKLPGTRKRPPHKGYTSCLAWAPWESHLLATGNSGMECMVHLWSLSGSDGPNSNYKYLQSSKFSSEITSLHFSPHVKELLSSHGDTAMDYYMRPSKPSRRRRRSRPISPKSPPLPTDNALVVHSYPSFQRVYFVPNAHDEPIVDSVLSTNGTSLLSYGEDSSLHVWKIWGERKKEKALTLMDKLIIR